MEKRVACVAGDYARPALDKRRLVRADRKRKPTNGSWDRRRENC